MLSLVLGPFLILLLFGVGFRGQQPEFRTVLVVPDNGTASTQVEAYREAFSGVFKLQEVTHDEPAAERELRTNKADVVVVVPPDVYSQLYSGRQVQVQVL